MFDMLKIFITFKSQKYTCSLTYALLLLDHWVRTQPLIRLLWCKYARVFYEESGEVALSHLSRVNYRSTQKQDISLANDAFVMRHENSRGTAFWEEETDRTFVNSRKSGAVLIDPDGDECKLVAAWLQTTIRNLTEPGLQKMYTRPPGTDTTWFNAYKCKLDAERKQQQMTLTGLWFVQDTSAQLKLRMNRAQQNLYKSDVLDVEQLVGLWPGGQERFDSYVASGEASAASKRRIKESRVDGAVLNTEAAEDEVVDDMNLLQRYAEDSERDSDLTGQEDNDTHDPDAVEPDEEEEEGSPPNSSQSGALGTTVSSGADRTQRKSSKGVRMPVTRHLSDRDRTYQCWKFVLDLGSLVTVT